MPPNLPTARIGGINIAAISRSEIVDKMIEDCLLYREGKQALPRLIFDANGQSLSMRETDPHYREALDQADLIHADGQFLVTLSRWRRGPTVPERSATTDMIHDACQAAQDAGLRFVLVGGPPHLSQRTKTILEKQYPGLQIVGCEHGYFSTSEEAALVDRINAARPDVVWIGLGKPIEQQFCVRNHEKIKAGWLITCGGCFHYITGDYRRAPLWMQRFGLEWLHRMAWGSSSLKMRYIKTNPHALYLALTR